MGRRISPNAETFLRQARDHQSDDCALNLIDFVGIEISGFDPLMRC